MAVEYPAFCGICGLTLQDEKTLVTHIGPCFLAQNARFAS